MMLQVWVGRIPTTRGYFVMAVPLTTRCLRLVIRAMVGNAYGKKQHQRDKACSTSIVERESRTRSDQAQRPSSHYESSFHNRSMARS